MALQLQNVSASRENLDNCDVDVFTNVNSSLKFFTRRLIVNKFRHLANVTLEFTHPVTAIAGANRAGKSSVLLLLACSHEKFMRPDATSSQAGIREHGWNDVLSFTAHENVNDDYQYAMDWRRAAQVHRGTAKRLHTSRAWSGLGKKSADTTRMNAKIREREVRLIDLERLLPARAFSESLYRKANAATASPLNNEITQIVLIHF